MPTGDEYRTPHWLVDLARDVMGSIDCDPASSFAANESIKARVYYNKQRSGLTRKWIGNVLLNAPYSQPLIVEFTKALIEKYMAGETENAVVITNNCTETRWGQMILREATVVCFPHSRINFLDQDGKPTKGNRHSQMISFFGLERRARRFACAFSDIGTIVRSV